VLVIPAVDLLHGRCVRLLRGDFDRATSYSDDPLSVARQFAEGGARRIHVVDLDAARDGLGNGEVVEAIVREVDVEVEVAGGVRSEADAARWLDVGAAAVVIGTLAAEEPAVAAGLAERYPGRVSVAFDMRGGSVSTHGWEKVAGATLEDLLEALNQAPLESYIYTDIERDGTMQGPNVNGLEALIKRSRHGVVLSGGVSSMEDVRRANAAGAAGVILGRALYEGKISLGEALAAAGQAKNRD
jgi:phosphoribosylformimino-5-aminoimidazole carboxamide ribotide isomerase